jgi:hypothetical protein
LADNKKRWLEQTHPEYDANKENWKRLLDAYYGTGGYANGNYLDKYDKESKAKYASRKAVSYYPNYVESVIDTYKGHIFKRAPAVTGDNDVLKEFNNATNIEGTIGIQELMEDAFVIASVCGHSYIVVDKPNEAVNTRLEQTENKIRPYAFVLTPLAIKNWELDSHNRLKWVVIEENTTMPAASPFEKRVKVTRYRVWYQDRWELYEVKDKDKDASLIAEGEHKLGMVPIVILYNKKKEQLGKTLCGVSRVKFIAALNRRLFNLLSELDDLLRQQTFAILTYPTIDANDLKNVKLGPDRILAFDPSGPAPSFIAPSNTTTDAYEKRILAIIQEIMRLAKLQYTGVEEHQKESSGIALSIKFEQTNSEINNQVKKVESAQVSISELVCLWEEVKCEIVVTYPEYFGFADITTELQNALDAIGLKIGASFNKEYKKKLVRKLLPGEKAEIYEAIDKEIDAIEETQFQDEAENLDNEDLDAETD